MGNWNAHHSFGILVNTLLAIVKVVTGILGNSYALIADAIESTSDIVSSFIVWIGLKIASKPADKEHPYGYGKAEPMAAVVVSAALFVAAFVIIVQSIKEIRMPHHAPAPFTLIVLVVVVIVKELLFRRNFGVGEITNSTAVKTDAWHHRSDAITSAAVFIGISIALIGGPGFEMADDWAAMVASLIIIFNAYRMIKPAVEELMDKSPSKEMERKVREIAMSVKGVMGLDKCYIRKVGFDFYVDLHLVVDGKISVNKGHKLSHRVKDVLKSSNQRITNVLVHIEPYIKAVAKKNQIFSFKIR